MGNQSTLASGITTNRAAHTLTIGSLHLEAGSTTLFELSGATFQSLDSFGGSAFGSASYLNYVLAQGTGLGNHDHLKILGELQQDDGASLQVRFVDFQPVYGQIYNLMDWESLNADPSLYGSQLGYRDGAAINTSPSICLTSVLTICFGTRVCSPPMV